MLALIDLYETNAIPLLLPKLQHPNAQVRQRVCGIFDHIGGIDVIPALTALLNDPDQWTRQSAKTAIRSISERHEDNLRVLG